MCDRCAAAAGHEPLAGRSVATRGFYSNLNQRRGGYVSKYRRRWNDTLDGVAGAATDAFEAAGDLVTGRAAAFAELRNRRDVYRPLLRENAVDVASVWGGAVLVHLESLRAARQRGTRQRGTRQVKTGEEAGKQAAVSHIQENGADLVQNIHGATRRSLRVLLAEVFDEDLSHGEAIRRMREKWPRLTRVRARRIARTETIRASGIGVDAAGTEAPFDVEYEWLATTDSRTRETHAAAGGTTRTPDGFFEVGGYECKYPADTRLPAREAVNCVLPGTPISGNVRRAYRSRYEGEVVTLKLATGHELTATVNHPVLTPQGFVGVGALAEGDDVLQPAGGQIDVMSLDVQKKPPAAEQVFDALRRAGRQMRCSGMVVNFHGDRPAGEVEIVHADRPLQFGVDPTVLQRVADGAFANADFRPRAVLGEGLLRRQSPLEPSVAPAPRLVRGGGVAPAGLGTHSVHADPVLLAGRTPVHTGIIEPGVDRVAAASVPFGKSEHGSALPVRLRNLIRGEVLAPTTVIGLRRHKYVGDVYTLETDTAMYLTPGTISRNCRCAMAAVPVQ